MMNEDIMAELYFLLHSFGMGVLIMILYDVLRIFRKLVAHSVFALALEDLIYWEHSCLKNTEQITKT